MDKNLYYSFSDYLKDTYGAKVWRIPVEGGFTCPNRDGTKGEDGCIYCNIDSFVHTEGADIKSQVANRIQKLEKRGVENFIVYFQSYSNTYATVAEIRDKISEALSDERIKAVYIGTRADVLEDEKLDFLSELNQKLDVVIELGLQSSEDATLEFINRGHTASDFADCVRRCTRRGLKVCAHIIFGLPGETRQMMINTVNFAVECGCTMVKFHHLHIVRDTKLAELYEQGKVRMLTEAEYIALLADALTFLPEDCVVARLVGDAGSDTLIAPQWPENKSLFINKLRSYMETNNKYQGQNFTP